MKPEPIPGLVADQVTDNTEAVQAAELRVLERRVLELEAAIEEYLLWEPGRRGHAAAHRELRAVLRRPADDLP